MKKTLTLILAAVLALSCFAGCGSPAPAETTQPAEAATEVEALETTEEETEPTNDLIVPFPISIDVWEGRRNPSETDGNFKATLHYVDADSVDIDIYESLYYHSSDIDTLHLGSRILLCGEECTVVEEPERRVDINKRNGVESTASYIQAVLEKTDGEKLYPTFYFYDDKDVCTAVGERNVELTRSIRMSTHDLFFFRANGEDLDPAEFPDYLKSHEADFVYDRVMLYIADNVLDSVSLLEVSHPLQYDILKADEITKIPGAVNPTMLLSPIEAYNKVEGDDEGTNYRATLTYLSDSKIKAEIYRTFFYEDEDIISLRTGDFININGKKYKVTRVDHGWDSGAVSIDAEGLGDVLFMKQPYYYASHINGEYCNGVVTKTLTLEPHERFALSLHTGSGGGYYEGLDAVQFIRDNPDLVTKRNTSISLSDGKLIYVIVSHN